MLARLQLSIEHAKWLEAVRKIPCEVAAEMGVVSKGENLAFEYRRSGAMSFLKVRTPDKRFWIEPKGAPLSLWNEDCLSEPSASAPLIITEGEIDALSFLAAGATHVVSVPNGAAGRPGEGDIVPDKDQQFAYLWDGGKLRRGLQSFTKIILATDADAPGQILRDELAVRLGRTRCWVISYPHGCKDANEALVRHGVDALLDALTGARPMVPNRLVSFSEIPSRAELPRYSSGWTGLDQHLMIVPPELMVVTGTPGAGKALALDTEVPTPNGWTTMGELRVGDVIYDEKGQPTKVTRTSDVMRGRPCYRVRLSDGTEIVADAEHQWLTSTDLARKSAWRKARRSPVLRPKGTRQDHKLVLPKVVTTRHIAATLRRTDGGLNHAIALTGPVAGSTLPAILPVEPYTLGAWLGDGRSDDGGIVLCETQMRENLIAVGERLTPWADGKTCNVVNLKQGLRALGLVGQKHIPAIYLHASQPTRLALLQGLMDTDGHCSPRRACEFCSINPRLARDVYELVCSLGIKATLREDVAKLYGRIIGQRFRVCFTTAKHQVFRLGRKVARQMCAGAKDRMPHRLIEAVEAIESVPVRCIQVDSPSHLFLVTRSFVPTHNSQWTLALCANLARLHGLKGAILQFEDKPDRNRHDLLRYARSWAAQDKNGIPDEPSAWIDRMFKTIAPAEDIDEDSDFNLAWLRSAIEEAATRHDAKWVLVDPWNEIEHVWRINETETGYTNQALRELKRLTRRFQIALIIVTHPSKAGGASKAVDEMSLYDISGSAAWKNKADHGIIVAREGPTAIETCVKIDKSKDFKTMGHPGVVRMKFAPERASFEFLGSGP